jgi:hypothetical protein
MDGTQDIFTRLEVIEVVVIRATGLIGVSLFCLLYVWDHLKNFKGSRRRKQRESRAKKGTGQTKSD